MHQSQSLFNLITALHVSGVTITHLQEHKTTASTTSGNHYTVLLSAAIVEELEIIQHLQEHKTTTSTASGNHYTVLLPAAIVEKLELISNSSTIAADNSTV